VRIIKEIHCQSWLPSVQISPQPAEAALKRSWEAPVLEWASFYTDLPQTMLITDEVSVIELSWKSACSKRTLYLSRFFCFSAERSKTVSPTVHSEALRAVARPLLSSDR
jgi:hypothetical protein